MSGGYGSCLNVGVNLTRSGIRHTSTSYNRPHKWISTSTVPKTRFIKLSFYLSWISCGKRSVPFLVSHRWCLMLFSLPQLYETSFYHQPTIMFGIYRLYILYIHKFHISLFLPLNPNLICFIFSNTQESSKIPHPRSWDHPKNSTSIYICHHLSSFIIIYHDLSSFIIIYHDLSSFIMIYPHFLTFFQPTSVSSVRSCFAAVPPQATSEPSRLSATKPWPGTTRCTCRSSAWRWIPRSLFQWIGLPSGNLT